MWRPRTKPKVDKARQQATAARQVAREVMQTSNTSLTAEKSSCIPASVATSDNSQKDSEERYHFGFADAAEAFINHHVSFHGTAAANLESVKQSGLRESARGMFGPGLYVTHVYEKATWFADSRGSGTGAVFKVEFDSSQVDTTKKVLPEGLWRDSSDAVYAYAGFAKQTSEMVVSTQKVSNLKISQTSGSFSAKTRARIDEFFIKNPGVARGTVRACRRAEIGLAKLLKLVAVIVSCTRAFGDTGSPDSAKDTTENALRVVTPVKHPRRMRLACSEENVWSPRRKRCVRGRCVVSKKDAFTVHLGALRGKCWL